MTYAYLFSQRLLPQQEYNIYVCNLALSVWSIAGLIRDMIAISSSGTPPTCNLQSGVKEVIDSPMWGRFQLVLETIENGRGFV